MPRRALPPTAVAAVDTLLPPPPPSPLIQKLRQDYRWASISQFCWTFSDAFGLVDWDIDRLEADFDGDENQLIPDLLVKLLFALTYNRQIKRDNVMENIRKQYEKRTRPCVLGTIEEPIEWAILGLGQKVQLLYELCEIQMEDAARFRGLLKSEEDAVSWRIDPVGWDKAGNTYFLFDDNRLWVQRLPPAPPAPPKALKKSSQKAKRALKRQRQDTKPAQTSAVSQSRSNSKRKRTPPPVEEKKPKIEEPVSGARRRTQVSFYGNVTPTVAALKRGATAQSTPSTSRSTRATRGHPVEQAPGPTPGGTPSRAPGKGKETEKTPVSVPRGTRTSRRLRDTEDEWQQVPAEWLNGEGSSDVASGSKASNGRNGNKRKLPAGDDDESDLSELTDEEEHKATVEAIQGDAKPSEDMDVDEPNINGRSAASSELSEPAPETDVDVEAEDDTKDANFSPASEAMTPIFDDAMDEPSTNDDKAEVNAAEDEDEGEGEDGAEADDEDEIKLAVKEANNLPEGLIEWEAVCVTLYDWRTFPEQFAKSRDPDEKALYHLLAKEVGPTIIGVLVEKAQELARQEAVLNRKRSSRIATIQLSKEEALRQETAQREMEERMERTRWEETRQEREEAEAARKEQERHDRLREREERAQAREEAIQAKAREEFEKVEKAERDRQERAKRREEGFTVSTPEAGGASGSGSQSDRWELNCEVCKKTGWNVDEDEDVVACEDCGRWQHMGCHDLQDMREGRKKRRWDKVDFRCQECLAKMAKRQANQPVSIQSAPHRVQQGPVPPSNLYTSAPNHQRNQNAPQPHHPPTQGQDPRAQYHHQHQQQHQQPYPQYYPPAPNQAGAPVHHVQPDRPHPNGQPIQHAPRGPGPSSYPPGPYPPQATSPYHARPGPPPGYPSHGHGSPAGPPPSHPVQYPPHPSMTSPRHTSQALYQHAPGYPPSPYGPPQDLSSRSPYQGQHSSPHHQYQPSPQHPQPSPPVHPSQTPPHRGSYPPQAHHAHQPQHYPPHQGMYPPHPAQGQAHYPPQHPGQVHSQGAAQHARAYSNGQYPPQQQPQQPPQLQQRRSEDHTSQPRAHPAAERSGGSAPHPAAGSHPSPVNGTRSMDQSPHPPQAPVQ